MKLTKKQEIKFQKWLSERPKIIQELGKKYPPSNSYIMKPNAPYGLSCEGTIVELTGYLEDGHVSVIVLAENKTPAGREHERLLCEKYNKDFEEISKQNVKVEIDPIWMEAFDEEEVDQSIKKLLE